MEIKDSDIYIGSPSEMNITGENIYTDADTFLKKLNLDGKIRVPAYSDGGITNG